MTNLANLTASQLKSIIAIKEQIEALQSQIDTIVSGGGEVPSSLTSDAPKKVSRRMSAAGRAKIAAAQRARWAIVKGKGVPLPLAALGLPYRLPLTLLIFIAWVAAMILKVFLLFSIPWGLLPRPQRPGDKLLQV